MFKQKLCKTSWDDVISNKNPNDAYNYFLQKLIVSYDKHFPKRNTEINKKDLQSSWITRGIKKVLKASGKIIRKSLKKQK